MRKKETKRFSKKKLRDSRRNNKEIIRKIKRKNKEKIKNLKRKSKENNKGRKSDSYLDLKRHQDQCPRSRSNQKLKRKKLWKKLSLSKKHPKLKKLKPPKLLKLNLLLRNKSNPNLSQQEEVAEDEWWFMQN